MPRNRRDPHFRPRRRLYLAEWLEALDIQPKTLAADSGVSPAYISELMSDKKKNPSYNMLADISDALGIEMGMLRQPPPSPDVLRQMRGVSPALISRLSNRHADS